MAQPYLKCEQSAVIREFLGTLIAMRNAAIVGSMDWYARGQHDVCMEHGDIRCMSEDGQRYHTMAQELNRRHRLVKIILESAEPSPALDPAKRAFGQRLDEIMTAVPQKDSLLGDTVVALHRAGHFVDDKHYALAREIDATTAQFLPGS